MADVVRLSVPDFTQAAASVAQQLETAAIAPRATLPKPTTLAPVDVAAAGAAQAIQTKIVALSTQLAPSGPAIRESGARAAASLVAQDAANSARMPSVPNVPSPGAPGMPAIHTTPPDSHSSRVRAVDHIFKQAPNPAPEPPPGGWSSDALTRAAEKIAHGHATGPKGHMGQFPGMTKDQLADLIHDMFTRDPKDLVIGRTADGAPALYDPKDNVIVIRDPNAPDCGTVFKPDRGIQYVLGDDNGPGKIVSRQPSLTPSDLADQPHPAAPEAPSRLTPAESTPAEAPTRAPIEGTPRAEGGFGAGPSQPVGPHLIDPRRGPQHVVGDWDLDPEDIP